MVSRRQSQFLERCGRERTGAGQRRKGQLAPALCFARTLRQSNTIEWLNRAGTGLLAIDEAHCVSQWGTISGRNTDARRGAPAPWRRADHRSTATADVSTRGDILQKLFEREPRTFVHGFDRPNLHLAMAVKENTGRQLRQFLDRHPGDSGIIYCASRNATERLAEKLAGEGFRALPYHAG
jgi:ATP-dependent DNA helicase RecQ